jgi:hypothetical protein
MGQAAETAHLAQRHSLVELIMALGADAARDPEPGLFRRRLLAAGDPFSDVARTSEPGHWGLH